MHGLRGSARCRRPRATTTPTSTSTGSSARWRAVAFDAMIEQFAARPDVVFGEMDVKGDLAAVAIAYPESGFVLFDVSRFLEAEVPQLVPRRRVRGPAHRRGLRRLRRPLPGRQARLHLGPADHRSSPAAPRRLSPALLAYPGIDVVDISDREAPPLRRSCRSCSVGGVHTTRSFDGRPARASTRSPSPTASARRSTRSMPSRAR